jgi:Fe-S-cluster containining protein
VNCQACRGACCESLSVSFSQLAPVFQDREARRWLELHATEVTGATLTFEVRCTQLTTAGACGIYADRPFYCRVYRPGGPECLATVRARRTPDAYQRIRDADDPPTL